MTESTCKFHQRSICGRGRNPETLEVIRIQVWIGKFLEEFFNNAR